MDKCILLWIIALAAFFGCESSDKVVADDNNHADDLTEHVLGRFCSIEHVLDDQTFVFVKSNRWDTSFVFTMHKLSSGNVRGAYYEISPLNDYYSLNLEGVIFFDGFSCDVDTIKLAQVLLKSELLLDTMSNAYDTGCLDCTNYVLSVGQRSTMSNNPRTRADMEYFSKYLKETLIYPVLKARASDVSTTD